MSVNNCRTVINFLIDGALSVVLYLSIRYTKLLDVLSAVFILSGASRNCLRYLKGFSIYVVNKHYI